MGWGRFNTASTSVVGHTACQAFAGHMLPNGIIRLEDPTQNELIAGPGNILIYSGTTATLYQVALHEVGHALGLADNEDPTSIMDVEATNQNASLALNDVEGIRRLYGPPSRSVGLQQAAEKLSLAKVLH